MTRARSALAALLLCLATILSSAALAATEEARSQEGIPFKQEAVPTDTLAYQSLAGLVLAGLAAYGVVLGLRRFVGRGIGLGTTHRILTTQVLRLSRRSTLYVVEYRGQELLLAENDHGIQLLMRQAGASEPEGRTTDV